MKKILRFFKYFFIFILVLIATNFINHKIYYVDLNWQRPVDNATVTSLPLVWNVEKIGSKTFAKLTSPDEKVLYDYLISGDKLYLIYTSFSINNAEYFVIGQSANGTAGGYSYDFFKLENNQFYRYIDRSENSNLFSIQNRSCSTPKLSRLKNEFILDEYDKQCDSLFPYFFETSRRFSPVKTEHWYLINFEEQS